MQVCFFSYPTKRMKNIYIFLGLVLLMVPNLLAQNQQFVDSLQHELRFVTNDTMKVEILHSLSKEYSESSLNKSMDFAKKSLDIAEAVGYKKGIAENYTQMGFLYMMQKRYNKAHEFLEMGLNLSKEIDFIENEVTSLNDLVDLEGKSRKYKKAYSYFDPTLKANARLLNTIHDRKIDWTKVKVSKSLENQFQRRLADQLTEDSLRYENQKQLLIQEQENARLTLQYNFEIQLANAKSEKEKQRFRYENQLKQKELDNEFKQKAQQMEADYQRQQLLTKAAQEKKDALAAAEKVRLKSVADERVRQADQRTAALSLGSGVLLIFAMVFFGQRNKIRKGKKQSDALLLNILPAEVAEELKKKGSADAKKYEAVSVLFTDFKDFTQISEKMTPEELVAELNTFFRAFDEITLKYKIEKIKTIGDSYMCVAGLPSPADTHAEDAVRAAIEIQAFVNEHSAQRIAEGKEPLMIRIGIHSGPAVAGIVGTRKYAYDIWGDTVNTASRMESSGEPGRVNISGTTFELVKNQFKFTSRGKIEAKHKGLIDMYFVEGEILEPKNS